METVTVEYMFYRYTYTANYVAQEPVSKPTELEAYAAKESTKAAIKSAVDYIVDDNFKNRVAAMRAARSK